MPVEAEAAAEQPAVNGLEAADDTHDPKNSGAVARDEAGFDSKSHHTADDRANVSSGIADTSPTHEADSDGPTPAADRADAEAGPGGALDHEAGHGAEGQHAGQLLRADPDGAMAGSEYDSVAHAAVVDADEHDADAQPLDHACRPSDYR